jgi:hypothetical protein
MHILLQNSTLMTDPPLTSTSLIDRSTTALATRLVESVPQNAGIGGVLFDGTYVYFIPGTGANKFVRVELDYFGSLDATVSNAHVTTLDISLGLPWVNGFQGGFFFNRFAFLVPHHNGQRFHGVVVRVNLDNFTAGGVTHVDVSATYANACGFAGGFKYGSYGYLVPHRNNTSQLVAPFGFHAALVRMDLAAFGVFPPVVLDFGGCYDLGYYDCGFWGATVLGKYAYMPPYFGNYVVRIDLEAMSATPDLQLSMINSSPNKLDYLYPLLFLYDVTVGSTSITGFRGCFTDSQHLYLVPYASIAFGPERNVSVSNVGLIARCTYEQTLNDVSGLNGMSVTTIVGEYGRYINVSAQGSYSLNLAGNFAGQTMERGAVYAFNGFGQCLKFPFTIAIWFYATDTSTPNQTVISIGNTYTSNNEDVAYAVSISIVEGSLIIYINVGQQLRNEVYGCDIANIALLQNTWYHLVFTAAVVDAVIVLKTFLFGAPVTTYGLYGVDSTKPLTTTSARAYDPTLNTKIPNEVCVGGLAGRSRSSAFKGRVDDLMLYKVALSDSAVQALYERYTLSSFSPPSTDALFLYFLFNSTPFLNSVTTNLSSEVVEPIQLLLFQSPPILSTAAPAGTTSYCLDLSANLAGRPVSAAFAVQDIYMFTWPITVATWFKYTPSITILGPTNGLITYLSMDASLSAPFDVLGYATNGTVVGSLQRGLGVVNEALYLANDATPTTLNTLTYTFGIVANVTICMWLYVNSMPAVRACPWSFGTATQTYLSIILDTSSTGTRFYGGAGGNGVNDQFFDVRTNGDNILATGVWYHIALVWNAAAVPRTMTLYINGVAAGVGQYSSSNLPTTFSSGMMRFGDVTLASKSLPAAVRIDDFRVYNRVVVTADIALLYSRTGSPSTVATVSEAEQCILSLGNNFYYNLDHLFNRKSYALKISLQKISSIKTVLRIEVNIGTTLTYLLINSVPIEPDTWYHVAVVIDEIYNSDLVYLRAYLNGNIVDSASLLKGALQVSTGNVVADAGTLNFLRSVDKLCLGGLIGTTLLEAFKGYVYTLRLYKRALLSSEIYGLYRSDRGNTSLSYTYHGNMYQIGLSLTGAPAVVPITNSGVGFSDGFFLGSHAYLVPYGTDIRQSGTLYQVRIQGFNNAYVRSSRDITSDDATVGFEAGFAYNNKLYFAPRAGGRYTRVQLDVPYKLSTFYKGNQLIAPIGDDTYDDMYDAIPSAGTAINMQVLQGLMYMHVLSVSSVSYNFNIFNELASRGLSVHSAPVAVHVTVTNTATIFSTNQLTPALSIGPVRARSKVYLHVYGKIYGKAGAGGTGGMYGSNYMSGAAYCNTYSTPGTNGGTGGPAVSLVTNSGVHSVVRVYPSARIYGGAGGGGGGGGGGYGYNTSIIQKTFNYHIDYAGYAYASFGENLYNDTGSGGPKPWPEITSPYKATMVNTYFTLNFVTGTGAIRYRYKNANGSFKQNLTHWFNQGHNNPNYNTTPQFYSTVYSADTDATWPLPNGCNLEVEDYNYAMYTTDNTLTGYYASRYFKINTNNVTYNRVTYPYGRLQGYSYLIDFAYPSMATDGTGGILDDVMVYSIYVGYRYRTATTGRTGVGGRGGPGGAGGTGFYYDPVRDVATSNLMYGICNVKPDYLLASTVGDFGLVQDAGIRSPGYGGYGGAGGNAGYPGYPGSDGVSGRDGSNFYYPDDPPISSAGYGASNGAGGQAGPSFSYNTGSNTGSTILIDSNAIVVPGSQYTANLTNATFVLDANQVNFNLFNALLSAYGDLVQPIDIDMTIPAGITLRGTLDLPAFDFGNLPDFSTARILHYGRAIGDFIGIQTSSLLASHDFQVMSTGEVSVTSDQGYLVRQMLASGDLPAPIADLLLGGFDSVKENVQDKLNEALRALFNKYLSALTTNPFRAEVYRRIDSGVKYIWQLFGIEMSARFEADFDPLSFVFQDMVDNPPFDLGPRVRVYIVSASEAVSRSPGVAAITDDILLDVSDVSPEDINLVEGELPGVINDTMLNQSILEDLAKVFADIANIIISDVPNLMKKAMETRQPSIIQEAKTWVSTARQANIAALARINALLQSDEQYIADTKQLLADTIELEKVNAQLIEEQTRKNELERQRIQDLKIQTELEQDAARRAQLEAERLAVEAANEITKQTLISAQAAAEAEARDRLVLDARITALQAEKDDKTKIVSVYEESGPDILNDIASRRTNVADLPQAWSVQSQQSRVAQTYNPIAQNTYSLEHAEANERQNATAERTTGHWGLNAPAGYNPPTQGSYIQSSRTVVPGAGRNRPAGGGRR